MSKLLKKIQVAVETGSGDLNDFASVAGMTGSEFKQAFEKDAVDALSAFIGGLNDTERNGKSAIAILDDMGLTEVRLSNTILALASSSDIMNNAVKTANKAWEDNTALTNEANKRYETLKSQIQITINKLKDIAITVGNKLMPSLQKAIDGFGKWIDKFDKLSGKQVDMIVKLGLIVVAIGPVITIIGKLTSVIGGATIGIGNIVQAIGVMNGKISSTSGTVNMLASTFSMLQNPVVALTATIALAEAALISYNATQIIEMGALDGVRDSLEAQKQKWNELQDVRNTSLESSSNEIVIIEKLAEDLSKITEENGKIKDGYENRANFIVGELNNALGTELKINGDIISQYDTMKDKIDELIIKKKAEATLSAYQGEYAEALKQQSKATDNLVSLKQQLLDKQKESITANGKEAAEIEATINHIAKSIKQEQDLISQYGYTIQNYEKMQTASTSGSAKAIDEAISQIGISWERAKQICTDSIEKQIEVQSNYINFVKESLEEAKLANDTYQQQILSEHLETAEKQLNNLSENLVKQTSTIEELTPGQVEAWRNLANSSMESFNLRLSSLPVDTQAEILKATGVINIDTTMQTASASTAERVTGFFSSSLNISGETSQEVEYASNIINNDTTVETAAESQVARVMENYNKMPEQTREAMNNAMAPMQEEMERAEPTLFAKASAIAGGILTRLKKAFDFGSSSSRNENNTKLPGHRNGLDYVPEDNYVARLHKGERVLTKEENKEYTKEEKQGSVHNSRNSTNNIQLNIYCQKLDEKELDNIFNYINKRFGAEY